MNTPYRSNAEKPKETFPLEKILTVSARDYCESTGTKLSDYEMKGIVNEYADKFHLKVPREAEVVVNYVVTSEKHTSYASGTALIRK